MEYVGKMAKLLIEKHRMNKPLDKMEIKKELAIPMEEVNRLLYNTQEYLQMLGLEMIGISSTQSVPIDESKKLFIRKLYIEDSKRVKVTINIDERRLFIIISAIQLENNHMHEDKIPEIQRCTHFTGMDLNSYMNSLKTAGYLSNTKENEIGYWSLGWRYYVEYGDCFDIFEYFGNSNNQNKVSNS